MPFAPYARGTPAKSSVLDLVSAGSATAAVEVPRAVPVATTPVTSASTRPTIVTAEPTDSTLERVRASNLPFLVRMGDVIIAITATKTVIIMEEV